MGMLSNKELADALIINLANWDWSVNSKFSVDEATGKALVEEYRALKAQSGKSIQQQLDEISQGICDNYCKYPQMVSDAVKAGEVITEDGLDYLSENYCYKCPLVEKL